MMTLEEGLAGGTREAGVSCRVLVDRPAPPVGGGRREGDAAEGEGEKEAEDGKHRLLSSASANANAN